MKYAKRMSVIKKSYIREILKVTEKPEIISFAGGLPNSSTFPVEEIKKATEKVLETRGTEALQYSTTEGYRPLRRYVAERYKKRYGLDVSEEEILITTGSQQGFDLIGKVFLDDHDEVIVEKPGYLGALQSFSVFEADFLPVSLESDGINIPELKETLETHQPKLFYAVPNFQNPTGLSYSENNIKEIAKLLKQHPDVMFVGDDPYGELRYSGKEASSLKKFLPEQTILLGSFSKIVSPGLRVGWICAPVEVLDKLITVKQAADLHTSYFAQQVLYQYLVDHDVDTHIETLRKFYGNQKEIMEKAISKYFPKEVSVTNPEGGMFFWVTLPQNLSALQLLNAAAEKNVAFVPGDPFYVGVTEMNTLRLNFTNSTKEEIESGIKSLGEVIQEAINQK